MSLISREDAIKELMSWLPKLENGLIHWTGVKAMLENLPEADPNDCWILCADRLPNAYNVLCCDIHGGIMIGHLFSDLESETGYSAENESWHMHDCIAWMPKLKGYRPKEDK